MKKQQLDPAQTLVDKFNERAEKAEADAAAMRNIARQLLNALIHLEHNAAESGCEMGLALDVARSAIWGCAKQVLNPPSISNS